MVRGEGIIVLLRWLWEWQGLVQREGQAPRPTKSGWGSSNAKTYKHTQTLALRKVGGIVRKISLMVQMAEQSLRLDGRKVCNIKRVGISQAESNKAKFVPCRQSTSL